MEYEELGNFSPLELQLITKNALIFNSDYATTCPECERNKSPLVNGDSRGSCLACIQEAILKSKPFTLKHLPERWPADEDTIQIAHEIINEKHPIAIGANIAYTFKLKHGEKSGKVVLGTCSKQSEKAKMLHGWDFIIELAWDMWAFLSDDQRSALLLHELCHIHKEDGVWKTNAHNVEEFIKVIEHHGLWKPDLVAFAKVINEAEDNISGQLPLPLRSAISGLTEAMDDGDTIEFGAKKLIKQNGEIRAA